MSSAGPVRIQLLADLHRMLDPLVMAVRSKPFALESKLEYRRFRYSSVTP